MGNYIGTFDPARPTDYESGRSERIGTNGSASVFVGLLIAAYILDQRPEMKRAARWLAGGGAYTPDGPKWPQWPIWSEGKKNTLVAVQALVDFNYNCGDDGTCTAVGLDARSMLRGLQLKRPTDPLLDDLGTMFERYYNDTVSVPLEPERVRRLAAFICDGALDHLQQSCWYANLLQQCAVITYAAAKGWPVHVG